jgi:hypothetical protein
MHIRRSSKHIQTELPGLGQAAAPHTSGGWLDTTRCRIARQDEDHSIPRRNVLEGAGVPVLQLLSRAKGITIGLYPYRFTGKRVTFLVIMVVLLRMDLRMELNKVSQRASQRAAKDRGRIGSESSEEEESDALPIGP